jgi:DNA-binding XRE family transcriptional regulator
MTKKTKPVSELAKEWLKDPEFVNEYEALEEEFVLAGALIDARANSNLTQDQIAERMGTSRTAVVRLEGGKGNPSLNTLRRFAEATGTKLRVSFEPSSAP